MRARDPGVFGRNGGYVERRVGQLAGRYALPPRACAQMTAILETLAADDRAPTSVRDPQRAVDVHLADSLEALEVDRLRTAGRIADLGAGAGFPGLPLAVALPASEVRLVESQSRKCQFLRKAIAAAGVDNARVIESRVEEWREGLGAHDVALARALAAPAVVLEYAAPLLAQGGVLIDWRGRRNAAEERDALVAAGRLGLELVGVRRVRPYEQARAHNLHIYLKVRQTPEGFPRRTGMARKKPLAAGD
jgi:16S rRNA (guanine527-N7)-methyltransferase